VNNEALSDEYVANAVNILQSQIQYAGYRLNNLLQQIYSTSSSFETMQQ
jgi:hypothetical protein